jgi:hypothetical protein
MDMGVEMDMERHMAKDIDTETDRNMEMDMYTDIDMRTGAQTWKRV